jgi:hypothetical protein
MVHEKRLRMRCFLAVPHTSEFQRVLRAIQEGARKARFRTILLDKKLYLPGAFQEDLVGELARADCIVADITSSLSILYLWVESLQLYSCISGGELPINTLL